MNAITIISLQFKKFIDKFASITAELSSLKKRIETIEGSPAYTGAGQKEEFIVLTKDMFNSNGYPFTEKPIKFTNKYTSPVAQVYINHKTIANTTTATTIQVYSLSEDQCFLRYGPGVRPDQIGNSYRAILHVQETGTDPALFKKMSK